MTITAADIPGATLSQPLESHAVPTLKWWLLCSDLKVPMSWRKQLGLELSLLKPKHVKPAHSYNWAARKTVKGNLSILRRGAPTHDTGVTGHFNVLVLSSRQYYNGFLTPRTPFSRAKTAAFGNVLLNRIYGTDRTLGALKVCTQGFLRSLQYILWWPDSNRM